MPGSSASGVRGLRLPSARRSPDMSVSAASIVNESTPPDSSSLPPTITTRAPILSQVFSVCEALRSDTRTGSPPRIRSRTRNPLPGSTSLTSYRLITDDWSARM